MPHDGTPAARACGSAGPAEGLLCRHSFPSVSAHPQAGQKTQTFSVLVEGHPNLQQGLAQQGVGFVGPGVTHTAQRIETHHASTR